MFHLLKDTVEIENNLLWVKSVRDSVFSMWFNIVLLVLVLSSFGYFLYRSYGTSTPPELQKIQFQPNMWHNAVKNVPSIDYGQIPQTQTGDGVPGRSTRTGATEF